MNLLPVFLVGLMGSMHCLAMCGGIVGALNTAGAAPAMRVVSYNLGRIASYAMAGALAGGISAGVLHGAQVLGWMLPLQRGAYIAVNLMLILLGLHLGQWWSGVLRIERLGQRAWRSLRPLTAYLLPVDSAPRALLLGSLWGWLPCGMVYSALLTAMLAGDAMRGALTMLAFGVGTLPMLLAAGLSGARLRTLLASPGWRRLGGVVVLGFGVLGLLRAAELGGLSLAHGWLDVLCITPAHQGWP